MLYQTHHHPSPPSSSPFLSSPTSPPKFSLSHTLRRMESVELALNRNEKIVTDDDFSVDDLLDLSNDDVYVEDDEPELIRKRELVSVSSNDDNTLHRNNQLLSPDCQDFGPLPTTDLSLPTDDVAELEWLSNFVEEDSFTPYSVPTNKPVWLTGDRRHPVAPVHEDSCFKALLPVKFRTKRPRTGVSVWSLALPPDSSSTSSSSSSSSISAPSSPLWLSGAEFLEEKKAVKRQKKPKKKALSSLKVWENGAQTQTQTQTQTRRCTHCGVQKTPQWRAGPLGAKTLCNACGVRFKSGRLLPEYRPACSPTFSSDLHSNHHRKVIEMRRKKETSTDADEPGLNQVVQSF